MKDNKELCGTLRGFDDFLSLYIKINFLDMVLDEVIEQQNFNK